MGNPAQTPRFGGRTAAEHRAEAERLERLAERFEQWPGIALKLHELAAETRATAQLLESQDHEIPGWPNGRPIFRA